MTTAADVDVSSLEEPVTLGRRAGLFLRAGIVASYAGIVVLRPALPHNTAFVDVLLAAVSFGALLSMGRHGSPATRTARAALPWIWLIILGSLLGLAGVGMAFWGTSDLAIGLFAFVTFFCFWHLVYLHELDRYAVWGTVIGLGVTTFFVVVDGNLRNKALFAQPNYPGHYGVLAALVLVYACRHWWAKALAVVALLIIIQETGSFGAIAMVATALAVVGWRLVLRYSALLAVALIVVVIGGGILVSNYVSTGSSGLNASVPQFSGSINNSRFTKSKNSRFLLWGQDLSAFAKQPLGLGPAGVLNRKVGYFNNTALEVHNDFLSYLVERGLIGAIAFVGFWVVLWRAARRKGFARLMIIVVLVGGLFRETMHYRHVWLLLAMAYVLDARRAQALEQSETADDDAGELAGGQIGEPAGAASGPGWSTVGRGGLAGTL